MAFDIKADTGVETDDGVRSMTIFGLDGDLEITWDPANDAKVRVMIEKKMKEGVRFFILKPIVGDVLHVRRKLSKMSDLKAQNITIKDSDIEALFSSGDVSMFRNKGGGAIDARGGIAKTPDQVVRNRTVGVPALAGG